MKRLGILLALCSVTTMGFSQSPKAQILNDGRAVVQGNVSPGLNKVFGEITTEWVKSMEKVKVRFSDISMSNCTDSRLMSTMTGATKHSWESAFEALNAMASNGWVLEQVYTSNGMSGVKTHYIISASSAQIKPVMPWNQSTSQSARRR